MITMNVVIAIISLRKSDLIQLGERFDVFVIRLCSAKSMT